MNYYVPRQSCPPDWGIFMQQVDKAVIPTTKCKHCDNVIDVGNSKPRQFCNAKCRMAYGNSKGSKGKVHHSKTCQHCGGDFTPTTYSGHQKYCTLTCQRAYRNAAKRKLRSDQAYRTKNVS